MTSKSLTHLVFGVLFGCLFLQTAMAQISIGGKPYSFALRTHTMSPPPVLMPGINIGKLEAEDLLDEQAGLAPRFGDLIEVSLNTNNSGVWETLPDGGRLWRLSIMAAGAKSINLLYDDFYLPDGGVLYIYSADRKHVIGGFTSANNKADRIFATGLVYSDHIVLEYYEPAEVIAKRAANNVAEEASISINYVVHGYRFIEFNPNDLVKAFGSSGSCNVNTICSQGDNWRDQIKSVVMLLSGGSRFCTGYLVNNTAQDCRPLLLTANHCLGTADAISSPSVNTWTFMWRYESPNCTPNTDGPTNMTTNGGTVLANPGSPGSIFSSDFALIELAENPKTAGYDVYFAGFDATTTAPSSATGIHHPSGDVKKISMENAALTGTSYGNTSGTATHWRVADWDSGTTEPGSSGSPIFSDATKRAMGFLSGGGAACGNDLPDWYGSLGYSWTNGGASDSRRRLNAHLDPGGLATFVDGSANPCNVTPPAPCTGTTYSSAANLNLAIPDNNPAGVSSTITVATVASVTELKCVTVNLTHTWTGDLVATLTHVSSGTSVQLFRRLNASSSTGVGESSNLSGAYTFCATGASFATAGNGGGTDYIIPPGTYTQSSASLQATPAQNTNTYANFVGLALNGQWRLTISDYSADDIGTLSNWSFEACSDAPTCPTFSGAPANVGIVNSTCSSNVVSGGSITAPTGTPCPAGSTLQYNVNNSGWTSTLPVYAQTGPTQSIVTRCSCDSDPNMVSTESSIVTTIPGSCAPANDLCANATPISCGTTISSSTINATAEPGSFSPCGVVQTTAGVWYTFTGDGTNVTLSTCSAANFDTKISVYTGGCAAPTCVAGNDDACQGSRSSVTFTATNGTVYLILIHGFGGVMGTFDLTMTCVAPCPTFSGAPANVSIVDSSCGSGCTLTGGSITAPTGTPCPAGSTLQYNVNNTGWTTSLPSYNQSGPAQTIRTRCACDNDANNVSAESGPVTTAPADCTDNTPPTIICPSNITQNNDSGQCGAVVTFDNPSTSDNCMLVLSQVTETFDYTGSVQNWVVPPGVTSITVDVYGGDGHGPLGLGGRVQATHPVTPGETLYLYVGGEGTETTGGFNGGGSGGNSLGYGGGGGASDIRRGGTTLSDRIIVAGGGGGTGSNCGINTAEGGHGGGLIGGSGCDFSCSSCQYTGAGGTQTAGGIAGPTGHGSCGGNQNGAFGIGGSNTGSYGTGGGGGYYGGGSGCFEGAGGGSSYTSNLATNVIHTQGVRTGDGLIIITYGSQALLLSEGLSSGSVFPVGTTQNTFTVSDASGNMASCSFNVTIIDAANPSITCPATQTLTLGTNCSASLPDYTSLATNVGDNCGVQSVTQSPEAGTTVSGAGNMTVTLTVTDVNGRSSTCSFTVTKVDNTAPSIICPATQTLALGANCSATLPNYTSLATVGDGCGVQSVTQSPEAGTTVSDAGNMTVTLTVTDINGLTNTCSFTVTIADNTQPSVQCFNQIMYFNGEENIQLNSNDLANATDNCDVQSISLSPTMIQANQVGQNVPVTVTVMDVNGNTNTCTAQVTVSGLPVGWSQNPNGVNCANGNSIAYNAATGVYTATSTNCFYGPPFTGDATAFAQRTLCGDGSITALVTGITPLAGGWAGIVMRENNTAGAKKAQLMTNLGSDHRREFRIATNGSAQMQQFPSQNRYWLRITRVGNQFTMFVSSNGVNWFPAGAQNIVMPSCIQMGLVATNYTANSTVTATFSNVSFTGSNSGLGSPFTPDVFTPLHSPLTPEFDVYPNPTGGELNVDLTHYVGRPVRFEVYSLEGKLLQFNKIDEVQTTVVQMNMSDLTTGMYLIKVKSAGLPDAVQKVVLQRK